MSSANSSSTWYKVADLRPQLHDHISSHRHEYRHQAWFVLLDSHKGRSHRFNAMAWFVINCMNGQRNMQELYEIACTKFTGSPPSQDELISLLGKLYQAELIQTDVVPDIDELNQRSQLSKKYKLKQYLLNPLALRFPLFNPDNLLKRGLPYFRPLFNKKLLYAWSILALLALLLALLNWPELSNATRLHAFSTQNLVILFLIYPLIKLVHELGHAWAIKHYGGEVNEMGIMLMVFIPIPYVNAYHATAFPNKQHRMLVSAMGIIIESSLAAMALFIWLIIEPGLLRSICLDIMLIGGISTLLINGNPLLRFDGYYVLADTLETPNLASRSKKYLSYRLHQLLFKIDKPDSGLNSDNEAILFIIYALAALIYRLFIMFFILGMLLDSFFAIGIMLAAWAISLQIIRPCIQYTKYLASSEQILQNRQRVYSVIGGLSLVILLALFVIPVSQTSTSQGIIWLSEEMQIKAKSPGFIRKLSAATNDMVKQGDVLLEIDNPLLSGKVRVLKAKLRELKIKLHAKRGEHLETEKIRQEMEAVQLDLDIQQERLTSLRVRSPASGRLIIPEHLDLLNQYVQSGQTIGFILEPEYIVAQIIIPEREIALFQQATSEFEIRAFGHVTETIPASFKRLYPEAIKQLPSAALGIKGGGNVLVDPEDPKGLKTMEKVFQIELSLPDNTFTNHIGNRVHVRVRHRKKPLAWQWGRNLQQLLLGRFNV